MDGITLSQSPSAESHRGEEPHPCIFTSSELGGVPPGRQAPKAESQLCPSLLSLGKQNWEPSVGEMVKPT